MKTLEQALEAMRAVDGWFTEQEGEGLYRAACELDPDGIVVEIGSFHGRSTTVLACTGRRIVAVDPLSSAVTGWAGLASSTWTGKSLDLVNGLGDRDVELLRAALAPYPNVQWLRQPANTLKLEQLPRLADMVFIDGNHSYPAPSDDLLHCLPMLRRNATVCFHDYCNLSNPDVVRCIEELAKAGHIEYKAMWGTLWVGRTCS